MTKTNRHDNYSFNMEVRSNANDDIYNGSMFLD